MILPPALYPGSSPDAATGQQIERDLHTLCRGQKSDYAAALCDNSFQGKNKVAGSATAVVTFTPALPAVAKVEVVPLEPPLPPLAPPYPP